MKVHKVFAQASTSKSFILFLRKKSAIFSLCKQLISTKHDQICSVNIPQAIPLQWMLFMTFNAIQNIPTSSTALLGKWISLLFAGSNMPSKNYSFFKFSIYLFQVFYPCKKSTQEIQQNFKYCSKSGVRYNKKLQDLHRILHVGKKEKKESFSPCLIFKTNSFFPADQPK